MNLIICVSVILFGMSLILTYQIRRLALKHKIIDIPNERSSHVSPTPRGGGLAIVIVWFLGISVLFFINQIDVSLYCALLSGILLAIVSLRDDIMSVSPKIRLAIQFLTATLALFFLKGINPIEFSGFSITNSILLYPIAVTGIVWFINLYNFLDGIDGYSSLEAITIAIILFIFSGNIINLVLVASVAGFLCWNWPKAKIFMGDIGSTQLGFILVVLGLYFHNQAQISIIHWMMISSLFWFDATLTLFRRWRNHEVLSVAHRKHVYQRAVQSGLTHLETIIFSVFINIVLLISVLAAFKHEKFIIAFFAADILFLYCITIVVDKRFPFKTKE
jgi:Fuc2NAc and GlcNAc transferase